MISKYKSFLSHQNLAENTIRSYVWTVRYFLKMYGTVSKKHLLEYKGYLVENHNPHTVNQRLQPMNKYLDFIGKGDLKLRSVKLQQKNFLDRFNDLALLADLMGHESIETTRIYLRRTSTEQQAILDRVVDW